MSGLNLTKYHGNPIVFEIFWFGTKLWPYSVTKYRLNCLGVYCERHLHQVLSLLNGLLCLSLLTLIFLLHIFSVMPVLFYSIFPPGN